MPKKQTSKTNPNARLRTKHTSAAPTVEKMHDLQVLIKHRKAPNSEALRIARATICNLIDGPAVSDLATIDKALFLLSTHLSVRTLPEYATLDADHIKNIQRLIERIGVYTNDPSQRRPLNFLMLAAPGAGKSHFIKCVGRSLKDLKIGAITYNMTSLQRSEDLIPALDAARNLKVEDKLPLLFLDEFDSDERNIPLLLPLLWDGELNLGQRELKLGRVIIVLAGSTPALPAIMGQASSMRGDMTLQDGSNPKIIDLLSRINGCVLEIPPFHDPMRQINRNADKLCMAIQLLQIRFGGTLRTVPLALIKFIVQAKFRYGVRSIAHLIELIPYKKDKTSLLVSELDLPLSDKDELRGSSLAYHLLNDEAAHGVVDLWKGVSPLNVQLPTCENLDAFLPWWFDNEDGDELAKMFLQRINSEF